jgi:hypothetical protein
MTGRPLYAFLPIEEVVPQLNEALREIADSLRSLEDEAGSVSRFGVPPFVAKQSYAKFGYNPEIDTGSVPEDVWSAGGVLVWPGSAAVATVVSSDANDAAAGTGAREIVLVGIDGNNDEVRETVALNGTTPVNSTAQFLFVNSAFGQAVGSGGVNAGTIDVSVGGNLVKQIAPGDGQCQCSHFAAPNALFSGEAAYITQIDATLGRNANAWALLQLVTQIPGETVRVRNVFVATGGDGVDLNPGSPVRLQPGERAWMRVTNVSASNEAVSAGITINYLNAPTL